MKQRYWCKNLYGETKSYVKTFRPCQQHSFIKPAYKFVGHMQISPIFSTWLMDFLGPFPTSIWQCVLTRAGRGYTLAHPAASPTAAQAVNDTKTLVSQFGFPNLVRVDNERCYHGNLFQQFARTTESQLILSLPSNLNGLVKSKMQTDYFATR